MTPALEALAVFITTAIAVATTVAGIIQLAIRIANREGGQP